jgi:DNA-binding CsgD family transcriptional regulator
VYRFRLRHDDREIELSNRELVVGRSSECDVVLAGGLVSRRHARFQVSSEGLTVEDAGSRNGVLVNDKKIAGVTRLAHGDVVCIGVECFEVLDNLVLHHPEHLSTLPPPRVPLGESDVDGPEQETIAARLDVLTGRETEVLRLLVLGHTQKEMAEQLHLSVKTVETHRARIAEKTGCRTRAELVAYAISAGMLGKR